MSVSTTGHRNGSRTSETGTELGLGEGDPSHDRFEDFEFVGGGCFECTPEQVDNADTDTDTDTLLQSFITSLFTLLHILLLILSITLFLPLVSSCRFVCSKRTWQSRTRRC